MPSSDATDVSLPTLPPPPSSHLVVRDRLKVDKGLQVNHQEDANNKSTTPFGPHKRVLGRLAGIHPSHRRMMLASRMRPPFLSAVLVVMHASRASAFAALSTGRTTASVTRPLVARGVSSRGGASAGRAAVLGLRKATYAPSLLRMASSLAGPPSAKDKKEVSCPEPPSPRRLGLADRLTPSGLG